MSNKSKKSKKSQPEEEPQQPDTPPEPEGEPEGGPLKREQEFLTERMTPLRPKEQEPEEEEFPPPIPFSTELPEGEPGEESETAEHRQEVLEEFRRRRRQKLQTAPPGEQPGTPEDRLPFAPPPPEAPIPPPANNWIPIGPSVLRQGQGGVKPATSGRTTGIAIAPGGTCVFIGAANGGVWRSDDTGQTWHSLMEAFDLNPTTPASDSLSVGAIAIDLANPDRLYVGSGEGAGAAFFGVGPIMTNNATAAAPAWTTEQAAPGSASLAGTAFYALALDPANPDRVVGASYRGLYRREPNGVGGFHWARKTVGGVTNQRVTSVVAAVSGGATTFYATRQGGPVFNSNDGNTWNEVGTGFPATNVGRIGLAVQPDNPTIIYALVVRSDNAHLLGVYRLNTADGAWRQITGAPATLFGPDLTRSGQGWYDLAIAVAPNNVSRIYLGGSTVLSGGDWSGSLYRCEVTVVGTNVSMATTFIGNSIHADVHTIEFAPGEANKMWVGCDGGVFYSTNPSGSGDIFTSRNTGLQTLTMNHMGQHPGEDAVLFAGTQDNGGNRFTGEEAWLYSSGGDAGFAVVNWNDPYQVLSTYTVGIIRRSTNGGVRYSYSNVNVLLAIGEAVLFYAPLAGTPSNPGSPTAAADAALIAFGSIRPWISTNFGTSWQSIPNNTLAGDSLAGPIRSLAFASPNRFYAGTFVGWVFVGGAWTQYTDAAVYRFDRTATGWNRTRLDTLGGANNLPLDGSVTDIAVDPSNTDRIYITFGGTGDYRHVWFFNGTQWQQRSGPSAGSLDSLLDVQANAIVVDPVNPAQIYVGTDIGVWRSTNSGGTWEPFSEGLPDSAVMDLLLHNPRRVLRASTHGRSVWERTVPDTPKEGIELYVRDTQLDQGRFTTVNGLPDPIAMGQTVRHWAGPDIKVDTPDATGQYQFPLTGTIDFHQFVDTLSDDASNVATHATATITTHVYVQVHNRGVLSANNVRVMLLLANASAGLPALPAGYWTNVQTGMPITTTNWRTVGIATVNDVRVGAPKIAAFDLPSSLLPPPASLAGNHHHCVLALVHHPNDQYTSTITNTDLNSLVERKAAHKNLTVVQFTGTLPLPPIIYPFRIHNAELDFEIHTSVRLSLQGYPGKARLYFPSLDTASPLEELLRGMKIDRDFDPFREWMEEHHRMISENLDSEMPYDKEWSMQRLEDMRLAFETGIMLRIDESAKVAELRGIRMEPDRHHTFFLALDQPPDRRIGQNFTIDIVQTREDQKEPAGGLTLRVEVVEEPVVREFHLELWTQTWLFGYMILRARLFNPDGQLLTPEDGARVNLHILDANRWYEVKMPWHSSWRSFYYYSRGLRANSVIASGLYRGQKVVEAFLSAPEVEALAETAESGQ